MSETLSILICSIPVRQLMLEELLAVLEPQCLDGRAKVYVDQDPSTTIGQKRNRMLAHAHGDYCAFVDDDDMVSHTYVQEILCALEHKPDCASLTGYYFEGEDLMGIFNHSIDNREWKDGAQGIVKWFRPPNHLNAIKRSLIPPNPFPEIDIAEDKAYSETMLPLLHTEGKIEAIIYQYMHRFGGITTRE